MTDYFDLSPGGDMTIVKGGATRFTTAGRLVSLLPSASFGTDASPHTITPSWPDFTKYWLYNWRWLEGYITGSAGKQYHVYESGYAYISAPAQEWSQTTVLAAAPAGCNLFASKVRINRTGAPTATWFGQTVTVKPTQNVWIPFTGSVLLEAMLGMSRAMSLYIDGSNNLVLHQQQSVASGPGFTDDGTADHVMDYGTPPNPNPAGGDTLNGGGWAYGTQVGLPVFLNGGVSIDHGITTLLTPGYPSPQQNTRRTTNNYYVGPNAVSVTDTTNYSSTYSIDIVGEFGRAT